jgi:hypothetical protein
MDWLCADPGGAHNGAIGLEAAAVAESHCSPRPFVIMAT